MDLPASSIPPETAAGETGYLVVFQDDDWDHWDTIDQAPTYIGYRVKSKTADGHHWEVYSHDGAKLEWNYADDEVIILEKG